MRISIFWRTGLAVAGTTLAAGTLQLLAVPQASARGLGADVSANICRDAALADPQFVFCGSIPPPAIPAPPTPTCTASATGTGIAVNWTVVPNPNSPISSFSIERGSSADALSIIASTPPSASSYTDPSLAPGPYYYEIVSVGPYGESGSLECPATVVAPPPAPAPPPPPSLARRHPPT